MRVLQSQEKCPSAMRRSKELMKLSPNSDDVPHHFGFASSYSFFVRQYQSNVSRRKKPLKVSCPETQVCDTPARSLQQRARYFPQRQKGAVQR